MKKRTDPRHIARQVAMQTLFEWSFHPQEDLLERLKKTRNRFEELNTGGKQFPYKKELLREILLGVKKYQAKIDEVISACAPEWPLEQIARVDLAILRIAVFEVLYYQPTPTKVAIDEAVELAKEYGGENSSRFVNGVLGTVVEGYLEEATA